MKKKHKILLSLLIIISSLYFLTNYLIGNKHLSNLKNLFSKNQVEFINKYFFPYKTISKQKKTISKQKDLLSFYLPKLDEELQFREDLKDITTYKKEQIELIKNLRMHFAWQGLLDIMRKRTKQWDFVVYQMLA